MSALIGPGAYAGDSRPSEASLLLQGAAVQGVIGESDNAFVIPAGAYFHPIYNDVTGGTDKLLTASMKLGLLQHWPQEDGSQWSAETVAFWRLLTPAVKPAFERPDLPEPVGRYADWRGLHQAVAFTENFGTWQWKNQLGLAWNEIGNKGGRQLHRWVHEVTKNSLENLEYTDQPEGQFATVQWQTAAVRDLWAYRYHSLATMLSYQFEHSKMMVESAVGANLLFVARKSWWVISLSMRLVRQHESEAYGDIKPFRYEGSIGVQLLTYFTPTVKYVSSYLEGDDIGQTYFDLITINMPF